jgi:hypothetical protein
VENTFLGRDFEGLEYANPLCIDLNAQKDVHDRPIDNVNDLQ